MQQPLLRLAPLPQAQVFQSPCGEEVMQRTQGTQVNTGENTYNCFSPLAGKR